MPSWFRTRTVSAKQPSHQSYRPSLEPLEDRVVLASPRSVLIAQETQSDQSINKGAGYANYKDSGLLAWNESYILSAYLVMYHATQDTTYLDKFVSQANLVLKSASDPLGTGYLGWASRYYSTDGGLAQYAVHEGMITAPMAQFADYVRSTPTLKTNYGATATRYVNFIENNILPKWDPYYQMIGDDGTSGTYTFPDDNSSWYPYLSLPYNMNAAMGRLYLWLYGADPNQDYLDRASELATSFKNNLLVVANGLAYDWDYADPLLPNDSAPLQTVEDTSHANIEVGFAKLCYQMGVVFTSTDMQMFSNTLTIDMWNHNLKSPVVSARVDGTGGAVYTQYLHEWAGLATVGGGYQVWSIAAAVMEHNNFWSRASAPTAMLTIAQLIDALPPDGQLLTNGSFETSGPGNMPSGWNRWQSTSLTGFRDTANAFDGKAGLTIKTNASVGWQVVQQALYYLPGAPITVTFQGSTNGSAAGGHAEIYDFSTGKCLAKVDFTNTSWQQFTLTTSAPVEAGHNLQLRFYQTNWKVKAGAAYFDAVTASQ